MTWLSWSSNGETMGRNWRSRVSSSFLNSPDCAVKYCTPSIDEMPLPKLGRAPPADVGGALKNVDDDSRGLQGLGTTEARKAGSDNCNWSKFFH